MNSALVEAAEARVDEVLPWQHDALDLLGAPAEVVAHGQQLRERRRGGRPPGARNKRLDEAARLVRERFGDVLMRQVAVATMDLADLVALGLKPVEALAEQRLSAQAVLPYLEQRRPLAVDVTGSHRVVHLHLNVGSDEGEGNQEIAAPLAVELDGVELDDARKSLVAKGSEPAPQLIADQPAQPPPPIPPRPPARAAAPPQGGAVLRPPARLPAPASVVFRGAGSFGHAENRVDTGSGMGERG